MTRGHGHTLEARRLRGSVDQKIREYRVWSIEYRERQKDMVTGDGHGHREFRSRLFGCWELAPGFRRLKAERLIPERLTTGAVTRHLECASFRMRCHRIPTRCSEGFYGLKLAGEDYD